MKGSEPTRRRLHHLVRAGHGPGFEHLGVREDPRRARRRGDHGTAMGRDIAAACGQLRAETQPKASVAQRTATVRR